ncbi:hypothetical protein D869_gp207 [Caulobacter phage CcrRogue]|uniref:Uncharacterized protein n=1 Tax=Caulobacter phage CcrRogue TaxID=2927986 RepID=K4K398_9CAUD|nr:hypothetical protein D869_gp207 [Caulobacter phage CcrRogue]AFU86707.1 hypothetical protein CcrRogue_gp225 [Caulobacter phage CcrRogue]
MTETFLDRVKPAWIATYSEVVPYVHGVSPPVADGQVFVDRPRFPSGAVATPLCVVDYSGVRRGDNLIYTTTAYPSDYVDRLNHKFSALPVMVMTPQGEMIGYTERFHTDHGPIFVEIEDARPGVHHSYPLREVRPASREDIETFAGHLTDYFGGADVMFRSAWEDKMVSGEIGKVAWNPMSGRYAAQVDTNWSVSLSELTSIVFKEKAPVIEDPIIPQETETTGPGLRFTKDQPEEVSGMGEQTLSSSELLFALDKGIFNQEYVESTLFERFMTLNQSGRFLNLEILEREGVYTITGEEFSARPERLTLKLTVDTADAYESIQGLSDRLKTLEPLQEPEEGVEKVITGLSAEEAAEVLHATQNGVVGGYTPASIDESIAAVEAATPDQFLSFGAFQMPKVLWDTVLAAWPEDIVANLRAIYPMGIDDRITFKLDEIPKDHFLAALRAIKDFILLHPDEAIVPLSNGRGVPTDLSEEEKAEQVVAVMPGIALLAVLNAVDVDGPAYLSEIRSHVGFVDPEFLASLLDNIEQEGLVRLSEDRDFEGAYELAPAGVVITTLNELSLQDLKVGQNVGFSLTRISEASDLSLYHTGKAIEALLESGFIVEVQGPASSERFFILDV